ncbi:helix-turn-helix transcriptional regulator [Isoptericola croceus]|uniref:helix-turn-helix transcriptional regulator n=1 Tax=Isoptericola croceus TaxID=3031406 RepID=UPI0023F641A4|nr:helix-turn-helix transcriptional regulator [Isoptericola croceus]
MSTRPYEQLASRSRQAWNPDAAQIAANLGEQIDAELAAQVALGAELRAAREAAGLTQVRLAELTAVQQAEVSRIERGLGNPTRDTLLRLAAVLGLRLALVPANTAEAEATRG